MTPINIVIPESLTTQKAELETTLAGIAGEEERLANQRKDIQVALQSITTAVAVLSGQTLPGTNPATTTGATRKPMSPEARQRIAEGLRRSAKAKAAAKAAQGAAPAPQVSAPEPADALVEVSAPETTAEVPADAQIAAPVSEEPAEAAADVPVPDSPRGSRAARKGSRA
jgi:peptidoglycan hydrolase CwlO-like protein